MMLNKKIILVIFVMISVTSCNGQNKKKTVTMEAKEIFLFFSSWIFTKYAQVLSINDWLLFFLASLFVNNHSVKL